MAETSTLIQYVESWKQAMACGLLNGRPYSEPCIKVYAYYVLTFLEEYPLLTVSNFKAAMLDIPVERFAKRLKLYESLNCFARYLLDEGVIDEGYLTQVKRYKPRRHLPPKKVTVDEAGVKQLLNACQTPLDTLIVVLLSQTGLRATEAALLTLSDIDLERNVLTVRKAKWGKTRRVGLNPTVSEAIKTYLSVREEKEAHHLMMKTNGVPMDRHGLLTRLKKLGRKAGVKVTPHALRRAFVTLNANQGRPLPMQQLACGHSDITTTRSYCLTSEDEAVEAMKGWG